MLSRILLLQPVLRAISDGEMIKLVFVWALRISAGLAVIGLLFASYQMWSLAGGGAPWGFILMFLLFQIALILLVFVIFNILLIRAEDIKALSVTRGYPVVSIFLVLFRSSGEIAFFTYSILGISFGLVMLFGLRIPISIPLPFLGAMGGGFFAGIGMMIAGVVVGFLVLVVTYVMAELIQAPVEMAMNTRRR